MCLTVALGVLFAAYVNHKCSELHWLITHDH